MIPRQCSRVSSAVTTIVTNNLRNWQSALQLALVNYTFKNNKIMVPITNNNNNLQTKVVEGLAEIHTNIKHKRLAGISDMLK